METRYFRLIKANTYQWRSKASLKLYVFSGSTPVAVNDPRDLEKFLNNKGMIAEVTEDGKMMSDAGIPMAFSAAGMVAPKSYQKMHKAPPSIPAVLAPEQPAPPSAPRTVSSSKKTTEPAPAEEPKVETPEAEKPKAEKSDAISAPEDTADSTSKDSEPKQAKKSRKKKSRKKKRKKSSGDDK